MFALTFHGENGPKRLGTGPDLRSFVENRLHSGMSSPGLGIALQQLKEFGEAHEWRFKAMANGHTTTAAAMAESPADE